MPDREWLNDLVLGNPRILEILNYLAGGAEQVASVLEDGYRAPKRMARSWQALVVVLTFLHAPTSNGLGMQPQ